MTIQWMCAICYMETANDHTMHVCHLLYRNCKWLYNACGSFVIWKMQMTTQWMCAICYTKAVNEYTMDVCSLSYRLVFKGNKRNPPLGVKQLKCRAGNLPPSSVRYWAWSFTSSSPMCLHELLLDTESTLSSSWTFTSLPVLTTFTILHLMKSISGREMKRKKRISKTVSEIRESHANSH